MLIDTHAHLDFPELAGDLSSVLTRAANAGVRTIVTIGIDLASSRRAIELAQAADSVFSAVGIHPHGAHRLASGELDTLRSLASEQRVVAIGEIGLDYYRDRQPRSIQRECLHQQLELACELRKPAIFHIREAYEDFLEIVSGYGNTLKAGVLHCFSGNWDIAARCLDLGFYLSIPGTVTFPKAEVLHEVVRRASPGGLLLETDAPFLAPVPYRGKANEPSYVLFTAMKVAELRQCTLEEIAAQTTSNALEALGLDEIGNREA
jgi:TatD DNase family protein